MEVRAGEGGLHPAFPLLAEPCPGAAFLEEEPSLSSLFKGPTWVDSSSFRAGGQRAGEFGMGWEAVVSWALQAKV